MADWKGRGKGRLESGNPTLSLRSGKGMGSGRPGSQPTLSITGGIARGGGRASSQPSHGANTSVQLPTRTYSLKPSTAISLSASAAGITAAVEYGGKSKTFNLKASKSTSEQRSGSTFKSASAEKNPRVVDPEGNFIFKLEIAGKEVAQFKECSGLKSSTTPFELEEGGMNHTVHKLPGQSRWDNLVLRAGVTSNTYLLEWRDTILQDSFAERRNGSVVIMTLQREEVRRYNFTQAWPVAWEGPSFDAAGAELAIEMIEIAHHGLTVT